MRQRRGKQQTAPPAHSPRLELVLCLALLSRWHGVQLEVEDLAMRSAGARLTVSAWSSSAKAGACSFLESHLLEVTRGRSCCGHVPIAVSWARGIPCLGGAALLAARMPRRERICFLHLWPCMVWYVCICGRCCIDSVVPSTSLLLISARCRSGTACGHYPGNTLDFGVACSLERRGRQLARGVGLPACLLACLESTWLR
jgi:hypothetical protein